MSIDQYSLVIVVVVLFRGETLKIYQ